MCSPFDNTPSIASSFRLPLVLLLHAFPASLASPVTVDITVRGFPVDGTGRWTQLCASGQKHFFCWTPTTSIPNASDSSSSSTTTTTTTTTPALLLQTSSLTSLDTASPIGFGSTRTPITITTTVPTILSSTTSSSRSSGSSKSTKITKSSKSTKSTRSTKSSRSSSSSSTHTSSPITSFTATSSSSASSTTSDTGSSSSSSVSPTPSSTSGDLVPTATNTTTAAASVGGGGGGISHNAIVILSSVLSVFAFVLLATLAFACARRRWRKKIWRPQPSFPSADLGSGGSGRDGSSGGGDRPHGLRHLLLLLLARGVSPIGDDEIETWKGHTGRRPSATGLLDGVDYDDGAIRDAEKQQRSHPALPVLPAQPAQAALPVLPALPAMTAMTAPAAPSSAVIVYKDAPSPPWHGRRSAEELMGYEPVTPASSKRTTRSLSVGGSGSGQSFWGAPLSAAWLGRTSVATGDQERRVSHDRRSSHASSSIYPLSSFSLGGSMRRVSQPALQHAVAPNARAGLTDGWVPGDPSYVGVVSSPPTTARLGSRRGRAGSVSGHAQRGSRSGSVAGSMGSVYGSAGSVADGMDGSHRPRRASSADVSPAAPQTVASQLWLGTASSLYSSMESFGSSDGSLLGGLSPPGSRRMRGGSA